jgi:hypothetical protein
VWGITNPGSHDTLSEFTRSIFDTAGADAAVFGVGWVGFAAWFLWHILGGRDKRKPASGPERAIPGTTLPLIPVEPLDAPNDDYDPPR